MNETSTLPPFPALTWNDFRWTCTLRLGAWAGFQSRQGPYTLLDSPAPSDGFVRLSVMTPDDEPVPPSPEQAAAFLPLVAQQGSTRDAVLAAMFAEYPKWQEACCLDPEVAEQIMPDLQSAAPLKALIGLAAIHISAVARTGISYVGFEFGCTWDEGHGLDVMTHAGRVVEVGPVDVAFNDGDNDAEGT